MKSATRYSLKTNYALMGSSIVDLYKSLMELEFRNAKIPVFQDISDIFSGGVFRNGVTVAFTIDLIEEKYESGKSTGYIIYCVTLQVNDRVKLQRSSMGNKDIENYDKLPTIIAPVWQKSAFGYCETSSAKKKFKDWLEENIKILINDIAIANSEQTMEWYLERKRKSDSLLKVLYDSAANLNPDKN